MVPFHSIDQMCILVSSIPFRKFNLRHEKKNYQLSSRKYFDFFFILIIIQNMYMLSTCRSYLNRIFWAAF